MTKTGFIFRSRGLRPAEFRPEGLVAFTLIELMIVLAIMGIVLTMSVPIVYDIKHGAPLRNAVKDVMEVCSNARRLAILHSKAVCVVFHPHELTFAVGSGADTPTTATAYDQGPPPEAPPPSAPAPASNSGMSGKFSDRLLIEMLDVDLTEYKDSDEVKVWFYPNGVCDELTIILRDPQVPRDPVRVISWEVTTGLASVETDPNKLLRHGGL